MYNGIGLLTPRGSGTSGHVQANKFNLRRAPVPKFESQAKNTEVARQPNKEILEHNRKRQVEVKLVELRDELEEKGLAPEEIDEQVAAKRQELMAELDGQGGALDSAADKLSMETHAVAERKQQQMEKLRNALGLGEVVWGEAFDQEVQEKKKQERIAAREAKKKEWEERQKQREEEQKRREAEASRALAKSAERQQEQRHEDGDRELRGRGDRGRDRRDAGDWDRSWRGRRGQDEFREGRWGGDRPHHGTGRREEGHARPRGPWRHDVMPHEEGYYDRRSQMPDRYVPEPDPEPLLLEAGPSRGEDGGRAAPVGAKKSAAVNKDRRKRKAIPSGSSSSGTSSTTSGSSSSSGSGTSSSSSGSSSDGSSTSGSSSSDSSSSESEGESPQRRGRGADGAARKRARHSEAVGAAARSTGRGASDRSGQGLHEQNGREALARGDGAALVDRMASRRDEQRRDPSEGMEADYEHRREKRAGGSAREDYEKYDARHRGYDTHASNSYRGERYGDEEHYKGAGSRQGIREEERSRDKRRLEDGWRERRDVREPFKNSRDEPSHGRGSAARRRSEDG